MNEQDFIDELVLDEIVIDDKNYWSDMTINCSKYVAYEGACKLGSVYTDPITDEFYFCNMMWRVKTPFIVLNEIYPKRKALRKGNLVVAIITHPFRVNLVSIVYMKEPND